MVSVVNSFFSSVLKRKNSQSPLKGKLKRVGMEGGRDVMPLLEERVAVVTGGRDRRGGPLLTFPTSARRDRLKPDDYRRLIHYLINIPPLRNQLSNEK
ncbi:kalirin-like isoform X1 [Cimex lectularius]|uniref:Uncharacterized protein n=1 Tax=Cimex lectularius TaxID=79782 RepID=A0A8I6SIS8_CIMLE|nr:kalirin-like isoform X1 [Cimex lectularius]